MGEFPPLHMGWDFPAPPLHGVVEDKDDEDGGELHGWSRRSKESHRSTREGNIGESECCRKSF